MNVRLTIKPVARVEKDQDGYFIEVNDASDFGPGERLPLGAELVPLEEAAALKKRVLELIGDCCKFWQPRNEAVRGSFAVLYAQVNDLEISVALSPAHIEDEREAFEASYCAELEMRGGRIDRAVFTRDAVGDYIVPGVQSAWWAWQARAALSAPPAAGVPEGWQPMETAPKDGTLLRLLVEFDDHPIEDGAGPFATVGTNYRDNTGEDAWQIVGWCWEQDRFIDGVGTPIGWLPMLSAALTPPASEQQRAVVMPERGVYPSMSMYPDGKEYAAAVGEVSGRNACLDELLRLNPHLAKGEGV